MEYTLETLKAINPSRRFIDKSTVDKVNTCITEIENDRNPNMPTYGDIVRYTDKDGNFYSCASVQPADGFTGENEINICVSGSHGFYWNHNISTSGGPWYHVDKSHFKLIGKSTGSFWVWGYMGAIGNGGVDFTVEVNLWECNINEQKYSTEFYDRQYIYDTGKIDDHSGYRWFGKYIAFKTLEDYKAWLKTFNGIEIKGNMDNQTIVWFDKNTDHYISLGAYKVIENYVPDTCVANGVRECKRVYDNKNHKMDTYITYDIPELDWRTNKEYTRARKHLNDNNEITQAIHRMAYKRIARGVSIESVILKN
ncbi:MAG: hypothetical protein H6Q69_217 [Firmicutes bacterium]|nr:hypothetical protein [Bacillota bacterium]